MRLKVRLICVISFVCIAVPWSTSNCLAQVNEESTTIEEVKTEFKQDKSGTNPINFTYDARLYNEYQWLNTLGKGSQNITTLEFRAPFASRKWQFRVRARYNMFTADFDGDGRDDVDESGFGDIDFRFLTIPYLNLEKKFAIAAGLETFLNTASDDTLGSGATSFGPQLFAAFFGPLGNKGTIVAPAYPHQFSVETDDARDDIHQGLIDI